MKLPIMTVLKSQTAHDGRSIQPNFKYTAVVLSSDYCDYLRNISTQIFTSHRIIYININTYSTQ